MEQNKDYNKESLDEYNFKEHIKKRPFMYFNNLTSLVLGLVTDCIDITKSNKFLFKLIIHSDHEFSISISSKESITAFLNLFKSEKVVLKKYYLPQVLKVITSEFQINKENNTETLISFSFNTSIIKKINIDYLKFTEEALLISILNKQSEIITIDERHKYLSQNYYCFPQGIFYLFDKIKKEVLGKPKLNIVIDKKINHNYYQIGLAYRTDWFPSPHILSFANNIETKCGGSLVDGIFDGLYSACKNVIKNNNMTSFKVKRKKLLNGLIIVCHVRSESFKYSGSFKEKLNDEGVYKESKTTIKKAVLELLNKDCQIANDFLLRFDKNHLTSSMY